MSPKKIVYLIGAGATHAEVLTLEDSQDVQFLSRHGLRTSDVSSRVIQVARQNPKFTKNVEFVTSSTGSINIELLISLLETHQIPHSQFKITYLKNLIEKDIKNKLSLNKKRQFYLHRALLELHKTNWDLEKLTGIISLNYDDVLDEAFKSNNMTPNYCLTPKTDDGTPLLKLHGSFRWKKVKLYSKQREIPIMPLGNAKNYLIPPYNFIWGKAFELIVNCDILRVLGCSLNPNDMGLIELLFKAHLERKDELEIQILSFQHVIDEIKSRYGFFGKITGLGTDITEPLTKALSEPDNPFEVWLKALAQLRIKNIQTTKYLKKL